MYKLSREDRIRIVYLYNAQNQTLREIAAKYPFSERVVRRVLREEGVKPRNGTMRPEKRKKRRRKVWKQADRVVHLYVEKKLSMRRVAAEFGCSMMPIKQILKAKGVRVRTLKESRRYRPDKYGYAEHQQVEVERKRWQPEVVVNRKMSVQEMRDKDLTIDEISEITGLSRVDVFQELQQ